MKDNGFNDRRNLVLLKYWRDRTRRWMGIYTRLSNRYVDNKNYENEIINELRYIELLDTTNSEMIRTELGDYVYKYPELPKETYTTDKGIKALKDKAYPSEMEQEQSERRFVLFQIIGILIAAIGGIITIFTAIFNSIKDDTR